MILVSVSPRRLEGTVSPSAFDGDNNRVNGDDDDNYYIDYDYESEEHRLGPVIKPYEVRVEEIAIVSLILVLWVCAILLFVHRWGKIRMLVPHQPRYAYTQAQQATSSVSATGNPEGMANSTGLLTHSRTNLYDTGHLSSHANPTGSSLQLYQQRRARYVAGARSAGTTFSSSYDRPPSVFHGSSRNNSLRSNDFTLAASTSAAAQYPSRPSFPRTSRLLYPQKQYLSTRSDDADADAEAAAAGDKCDRMTQSAIDLRLLLPTEHSASSSRKAAYGVPAPPTSVVITPCSEPRQSPNEGCDWRRVKTIPAASSSSTTPPLYLRHISEEPSVSATTKKSFVFPIDVDEGAANRLLEKKAEEEQKLADEGPDKMRPASVDGAKKATQV